jgi:DNA-binding SARP family transcriptional activator/tetratricopeptide (TPR) repeat protein
MSTLHIQLLSTFQLLYNGEPVTALKQVRLQSLLAYLVLHRHAPHMRQHLAFLFWPDTSEAQAYRNLRKALHHLRNALPNADCFLQLDRNMVQWCSTAPFVLDVAQFEEQLSEAERAEQAGQFARLQACLEEACQLYAGDLLPGCYDDWILIERERLRERFLAALTRLIELLEAARKYPAAIRAANRLLRADPLHEATYGCLMRLHALNGDRASALRVYHTCAKILAREFGIEPNEQMRTAYEHLLHWVASSEQSRARSRSPTPRDQLVGRQSEWQRLLATWCRAASAHPHLLVIAGEAGIGKTRLAEELSTWVNQQGMIAVHTRTYAAEGALAYAPITEWLRSEYLRVGWQRLDAVWLTELARLLPELLAEQPNLPRPEPLTESWQRKRLFEALARAVLAQRQALLLVLDDLQWCDRETLEWLHYLLRYDPKASLLIIGTVRPEEVDEDHPLTPLLLDLRRTGQVTEIELGPLDTAETATLASQVVGQAVAPETVQQLYQATAGNPLFVIEMMRTERNVSAQESGRWGEHSPPRSLLPGDLPPKVQGIIQWRLAQLSPAARELAGLAATIGRAFTFELLATASGHAEGTLAQSLDELWRRRLVREQGADAYDFSHDRIREVAYAELSPMRRRQFHRQIADALAQCHADALDTISAALAFHYEQAHLPEQAVGFYDAASRVAQDRFAYEEAIGHLQKAFALVRSMPVTSVAKQQELDMLIRLGDLLRESRSLTAPEVGQVYNQALALCQHVADNEQRLRVQQGLRIYYTNRGELQLARHFAEQTLSLAQQLPDPDQVQFAHAGLGVIALVTGAFSVALTHFEQAAQLPVAYRIWTSEGRREGRIQLELVHCALCLYLLGYPDQARQYAQQVLAQHQAYPHPSFMLVNLYFLAVLHHLLWDRQRLLQIAEEMFALATRYSFPLWVADSAVHYGFVLASQGETARGIAHLRQGLDFYKAVELRLYVPYGLAYLAEVYRQNGQRTEALAVLDEALDMVEQTGETFWQAELLRLRGEVLLASGATEHEVERWYQQALQVARQQEAKSLELRAAMSLSRLWQQQGRRAQAHALLAGIYEWFTEGFNTADLQAAKALLATLA